MLIAHNVRLNIELFIVSLTNLEPLSNVTNFSRQNFYTIYFMQPQGTICRWDNDLRGFLVRPIPCHDIHSGSWFRIEHGGSHGYKPQSPGRSCPALSPRFWCPRPLVFTSARMPGTGGIRKRIPGPFALRKNILYPCDPLSPFRIFVGNRTILR